MSEQLLNLNFVAEVKKHPCLYNYTTKEYTNRDVTEKAWETVGEVVNLSALQAKERWKNLRSVFVRNLKPQPKGSKKKKYYLSDAMQFIVPYIKVAGTQPGLPNQEEQDDENDPLCPASPPSRTSSPISDITRESSSDSSNHNYPNRKKKMNDTDDMLTEYIKSKTSKEKEGDAKINDANKMFLLSLLPDINCMRPTQIRTFKRQVIDLIDNILTEPASLSTHTLIVKRE